MRGTVPSPRETLQKPSDSLDNLHFDDWSSLLPWNAFLIFDTRFDSGKMNVDFEASTVTIAMSVSMTRAVMNAMSVSRPVRSR